MSWESGQEQRLSWIGKEKDSESGLGDFGVRKYGDGRFWSIDPLWEKYRALTPYQYAANSPLVAVDRGGDSVSLVVSGPATHNFAGQSGSNGLVGHVALNIDGKIFSFEGNGQWATPDYNSYVQSERKNRDVMELTLSVDQSKVQAVLDNRQNGKYEVEKNSCVTNIITALKAGGIAFNKPNGAVSPEQLYNSLEKSQYTSKIQVTPSWSKSSIWGTMVYGIVRVLVNSGIYNPTGGKVNTVPLLKKDEEK